MSPNPYLRAEGSKERLIRSLSKRCVFCGRIPDSKTVEHVVPKWLPRMAEAEGDFVQFAPLFRDGNFEGDPTLIRWSSFQFPACKRCNEGSAAAEARASSIFKNLVSGRLVNGLEISHLLSWFDKLRVGLWLGVQRINQNPQGVVPNFYINSRVGRDDRLLAVYRLADASLPRLQIGGVGATSFHFSPVAMWMKFDDVVFVSISHLGICANALGFPEFTNRKLINSLLGLFGGRLLPGTGSLPEGAFAFLGLPGSPTLLSQAMVHRWIHSARHLFTHHEAAISRGMPYGSSRIRADWPGGDFAVLEPNHKQFLTPVQRGISGHILPMVSDFCLGLQLATLREAVLSLEADPHELALAHNSLGAASRHHRHLLEARRRAKAAGWSVYF